MTSSQRGTKWNNERRVHPNVFAGRVEVMLKNPEVSCLNSESMFLQLEIH